MEDIEEFKKLEEKLRQATLDPKKAIEIAGELAIKWLGKLHEKEDNLRVDVAKEKVALRDANPTMSMAEVNMREEATETNRSYLKAKHATERVEEFIKIAKKHASIADGY